MASQYMPDAAHNETWRVW